MKILGMDTSTLMTTVAITEDKKLLGEYSLSVDMSHSEMLVPMIKNVLDSLKIKIEDIDLYAISIGPGSFTGLRIALATAKGFALAQKKPVIGVSTLEVLAYNVCSKSYIVPMLDARKDRVFSGIYKWEENKLVVIKPDDALEIEEYCKYLNKNYDKLYVNGNGSITYKAIIEKILGEKVTFTPYNLNYIRASSICEIAYDRFKEGLIDDVDNLKPVYLRESQAERQFSKGE
ncbi:MAG: tRNA (adenosine(37)-N6)-threonylcarbamoyltransferase complex dimerization subunit type 1 TsaB [Tissierellales bacterium]|nr:tRNA (adenosine(37)-N6)-threonylcarbamoyltransferase complex dimerization subunit type 1 TsaB [Tissierellales bacterium]